MEKILMFCAVIVVLLIQYMLSQQKNCFLGAIIPTIYSVIFIYTYIIVFSRDTSLIPTILAFLGGLVLLLSAWVKGREKWAYIKNQERKKIEIKNL